MATLKEHQTAMVDLLANGSGIPASASRLAHAMHDVLETLTGSAVGRDLRDGYDVQCDATTPGLNDKALSKPQKAMKTDSPAKWPTSAEQRVKELENTIKQLKANNAKLKAENARNEDAVFKANSLTGELCMARVSLSSAQGLAERRKMPEMTSNAVNDGCLSLLDAMNSDPDFTGNLKHYFYRAMLISYGMAKLPEQAGCRKPDTQCLHTPFRGNDGGTYCADCGAEL